MKQLIAFMSLNLLYISTGISTLLGLMPGCKGVYLIKMNIEYLRTKQSLKNYFFYFFTLSGWHCHRTFSRALWLRFGQSVSWSLSVYKLQAELDIDLEYFAGVYLPISSVQYQSKG